jgi:hypothetical protein
VCVLVDDDEVATEGSEKKYFEYTVRVWFSSAKKRPS